MGQVGHESPIFTHGHSVQLYAYTRIFLVFGVYHSILVVYRYFFGVVHTSCSVIDQIALFTVYYRVGFRPFVRFGQDG